MTFAMDIGRSGPGELAMGSKRTGTGAVMQLARPAIGYGVLESRVESGQPMRRRVNRAHALVRSTADSPVRYNAFDPRLQLWIAACLDRGGMDVRTRWATCPGRSAPRSAR
jgi:uncharacterized protein (DUF2236 family)